MNTLSRRWAQFGVLRLDGVSILFPGLGQFGEFFVPAPFQAVCHQTVFWPDRHELALCQFRLLTDALDLDAVKARDLGSAGPQFFENFECHLQVMQD